MKTKNNTCLNEKKLDEFIQTATARQLAKIWINSNCILYYWGMCSLEDVFLKIANKIPEIYAFINIDELKIKLYGIKENLSMKNIISDKPSVRKYSPLGFESEPQKDIPELVIARDRFRDAFISVPNGVEKAEAWLYPFALNAETDADLEALVYFKSKGETLIPSKALSEIWRKSICSVVARDPLINGGDKSVIEEAERGNLSLVELADLYKQANFEPSFLSALDNEEDFIVPTFFRIMEWFQLNEYEPWANSYAQEVSTIYQGGVDQVYTLFPLFYFCRSDFLLRKASRFGIEALLHGLCIGNVDSSKPWKRYWEEPSDKLRDSSYVDYLPTASIIAFAWQRINPTSINKVVLDHALLLLFQTQLPTGAWPLTSNSSEGCILSTCLAITALSVVKPEGYQRYVSKAVEWLLGKQNEVGCWNIEGGPAVMINVLCLESMKLAEGNSQVSYKVSSIDLRNSQITASQSELSDKYIVLCEGKHDGTSNPAFDEKCYSKIFTSEFPNAIFCSFGSCKDIEAPNTTFIHIINKVSPYHTIIKLIDRDDRSYEEIENLQRRDITVLSLRELESYLLDDEIIEKLCLVCDQAEKSCKIKEIMAESIRKSIVRGNPPDDYKSAAGLFFTEAKRALMLTRCGNDHIAFLRDTMAPLVTPETNVYKLLRQDIFGK